MSWACDQALTSTILNSYQAAGPLFVQTLQTFLAAQCALTGEHLWPDDATQAVIDDPNYDFIVVGAGSAGAIVANRLSENPEWKVLLVEAGGNPSLSTEMPQVFYNTMQTDDDWGYYTQPQEGACRAYKNKGCSWPRGKVLGGCSSTNAMFYVRANKADYDEWAADGNYGWSYEEVLPYFLKNEKFTGDITEDNAEYHSRDGPLHIAVVQDKHPIESMIIQAASELGMKNFSDVNGANQMGIFTTHNNVKDTYRFSTARAYLTPAKDRQNFHVIKNAYATKILFTAGTNNVRGILINKEGKDIIVNAKKEVIVSGGSINSAQLLMLSGLGPKDHLEKLGIVVLADLPVGENLQDHIYYPVIYTIPNEEDYVSLPNIVGALAQYLLQGTGPLKDTRPHRVVSFINTTDPTSSIPDMQHHYLVFPPGFTNMLDVFGKHGLSEEVQNKFREMSKDNLVIMVFNVLLRPKSKGKILLASKNPFDKPLIYANYFEDHEDMACILRSMKQHSLKLATTKTFQSAGCKLDWLELDACSKFEKGSDEYLECMVREMTFSLYHPTSTIKMGPEGDPTAVVDPELRVHNVKGLRVVDASIMPFVVRGNTNAPAMMIGEKGADMIKQFWLNKQHSEL